ncbi:MAG: hypothetical protein ACI9HE_000969 [Planctomycetota bacterium]|jgi:hypothetical protein
MPYTRPVMRMFHYVFGAACVAVPLLLGAALLGISGQPEMHLKLALVAAIAAVGMHTLFIMFMIITGRILREAVKSRDLSGDFLDELNVFFERKAAYPAAIFSAVSIVAAGVLGYGAPALGLPTMLHWLAGLAALTYNLWAIPVELRTLRENQKLVDRVASKLDTMDAETLARGEELPEDEEITAENIAFGAGVVAFSIWLPYFYWVFVVWRGDFSTTSLHPWVEISLGAFIIWFLARREISNRAPKPQE